MLGSKIREVIALLFLVEPLSYFQLPLCIYAAVPNSNTGGLWNVSLNLPSSYVSPSPSPDEMVIQQRGRRHLPVTWSPDIEQSKQNGVSTRDRTPVKASPAKSTIVLRSTPRKRLLLNDPKELFPTPEKCRKVRTISVAVDSYCIHFKDKKKIDAKREIKRKAVIPLL